MSGETILVVDDNHQMASFLAGNVLPSLGYATLVAHDGKTALDMIQKHQAPINLILLDYQLPDLSGIDLLQALSSQNCTIPVVLMTAHGSEQVAAEAFRQGAQDYIIKPVDIDILSRTLERTLEEHRLREERIILTNQLKEQVAWLTVLSNVGQSVTSTLEVDDVLRRIVEAGVYLTRADEGFIALLDPPSGQLYLRAAKNIDETRSKTMRMPVTDSLVGQVMRTATPLRLARPTDGPPLKVSTGYLVHSLLHVPLLAKGQPFGVLSVDNRTTHRSFKEIDESMLLSLADYAAVALENANLYAQAQQELLERGKMEQALRQSEERYALAIRGANEGLWDWDLKSGQVYYSPRWKAMLGYTDAEIGSAPTEWFERVHPEDREPLKQAVHAHIQGQIPYFEHEHRMQHKAGHFLWMLSRGQAFWDISGQPTRMAGSQTDITKRKQVEQRLQHDAYHDLLTGLPNRALLMERLRQAMEHAHRDPQHRYAVLFLDLDRFKDVNDSLGHVIGDKLLVATARLLEKGLRSVDMVARLGGDEFVILLDGIGGLSDATRLADRIQQTLTSSLQVPGPQALGSGKLTTAELITQKPTHTIYTTVSTGIVLSAPGYTDPEDVLRDADIALYRAKAQGRARYEVFEPGMRRRIIERLNLESELRRALELQEFCLVYQPIKALNNCHITGLEALVRWQHPTRGLLPATEFIPLAEETGLIVQLDRWVLHAACRQMLLWQPQPMPPLVLSVNISAKHFSQPDLLDYVQQVLQTTGLPPRQLNLEITSSAIMEDSQNTMQVLTRLKQLGVQTQIDDFGVGYASLSYLLSYPLCALKIPRTFVQMLATENNYQKIVQAIVMLAHGLGLWVIAEGVETEAQLAQLKALGCENAQGRYIAEPLDAHGLQAVLHIQMAD
jgi:diguanylate cyclase (GGDEF)-like protein/PAS domain S-box-containing protein